jgi:hypothetical protein
MKNQKYDRADLIFKGSIPDGTLPPGREIEIEATKEGLDIECLTIPWEWIDLVREIVRTQGGVT